MSRCCIENKHQKTCFSGEDQLPQGMTAYLTEEDIFQRHFHLIYTPSAPFCSVSAHLYDSRYWNYQGFFRGNSPGTFSWTSNIPPTSYICTVCGVYKDSWHSWLVRQPFQNLKKKKKKRDWDQRELVCSRPGWIVLPVATPRDSWFSQDVWLEEQMLLFSPGALTKHMMWRKTVAKHSIFTARMKGYDGFMAAPQGGHSFPT